jgi:hypothetical protein
VFRSALLFSTTASLSFASSSGGSGARDGNDGRLLKLPMSGRTVFYESPLRPHRYDAAFEFVRAAAARGDNVGLDEFPTFECFRKRLIDCSSASAWLIDVATCTRGSEGDDQKTCEPTGFVVVVPCRYGRSSNPNMCTVVPVVTSSSKNDRKTSYTLYRDLIRIGTSLAATTGVVQPRQPSGIRYSACVADVFISCSLQLKAFRDEGFFITASIPNAGKLRGQTAGHIDNYILYKELEAASPVCCCCEL